MKSCLSILAAALMLPVAVGCGPKPIVNEPATPPAAEQPAVEVDVDGTGVDVQENAPTTTDEKTSVDVQVGGGQGVQVDVQKNAPQE